MGQFLLNAMRLQQIYYTAIIINNNNPSFNEGNINYWWPSSFHNGPPQASLT